MLLLLHYYKLYYYSSLDLRYTFCLHSLIFLKLGYTFISLFTLLFMFNVLDVLFFFPLKAVGQVGLCLRKTLFHWCVAH